VIKKGDVISVLLGYPNPVALRPQPGGNYKLVGDCLVVTLQDSCGLLGPLDTRWKVQFRIQNKVQRCYYVDSISGNETFEDPRLGPLVGWESLQDVPSVSKSTLVAAFRNTSTGEVLSSDPRLLPEALRKYGTKLAEFRLI